VNLNLKNPLVGLPMVTSFNSKDEVDYDATAKNVEKWIKEPVDAFIIGTHAGEEFYLSEEERVKLLSVVTNTLTGDQFSVGGIDSPSVFETLRQAENYAKAGASLLRIRFPRNEETVLAYFQEVIKNSPLPILMMHQAEPSSYGVAPKPAARPEIIGSLASMDGVFGYVTDHDMRFESTVRRYVPQDKNFWICNGSMILLGTLIGCNGTTTAFSNIWPSALKELLHIGISGDYESGKDLQEKIKRIDELMLPYQTAGIKFCLSLMGFHGMIPRNPGKIIPDEIKKNIQIELENSGLI